MKYRLCYYEPCGYNVKNKCVHHYRWGDCYSRKKYGMEKHRKGFVEDTVSRVSE